MQSCVVVIDFISFLPYMSVESLLKDVDFETVILHASVFEISIVIPEVFDKTNQSRLRRFDKSDWEYGGLRILG